MNTASTDNSLSIVDSFQRYFSVELAQTSQQKRDVYAVRYRVYCEEFEYERLDAFPEQLEQDEYDEDSLHCLIVHKEKQIPAGCVRLVPARGNWHEAPLPFEKHCFDCIDQDFVNNLRLDRNKVCEISRLAVDGVFRRRSGETLTRFGELNGLDFTQAEQRTFSLIAVAAFLAATALTDLSGRTDVFAMMEPFLPRMLKKSGINFERAGADTHYHGIRAPYFIKTQWALDNMKTDLKTLYDWIYVETAKSYANVDFSRFKDQAF